MTGDMVLIPVAPKIKVVKIAASEYKKERIIRGKGVDETGEGNSYASASVKGTTIGVCPGTTGSFSLKYSGGKKV